MEGDGPTVFAHACKMGLEGIVSKRKELGLSFWPLAGLAQNEELKCPGRETGRRGRLGQMTRTHSLKRERWGENRPPQRRGRPGLRKF
jgi:hypothetical protein